MSLFPTPYPFHIYRHVYNQQKPIGCLVSNLAAQPDHIQSILSNFLKYDAFLERLVYLSKEFNKFATSSDEEARKKVQSI